MAVTANRAMFEKKAAEANKTQELNRERVKILQEKTQKIFNQDEEERKKQDPLKRVRDIFEMFDAANDGVIDVQDFWEMCVSIGREITRDQAKEALSKLDINGDGVVDFDEFNAWWVPFEARMQEKMRLAEEERRREYQEKLAADEAERAEQAKRERLEAERRYEERQKAREAVGSDMAKSVLKKTNTSTHVDKDEKVIASELRAGSKIDEKLTSSQISPRPMSPGEKEMAEQARVNLQREEAIRAAEIAQREEKKRQREADANIEDEKLRAKLKARAAAAEGSPAAARPSSPTPPTGAAAPAAAPSPAPAPVAPSPTPAPAAAPTPAKPADPPAANNRDSSSSSSAAAQPMAVDPKPTSSAVAPTTAAPPAPATTSAPASAAAPAPAPATAPAPPAAVPSDTAPSKKAAPKKEKEKKGCCVIS